MVAAEIPLPKPTIVIADDYPAMLEKVSILLRDDFDVIASAANGREAVDAVAKLKPDVVILDVAMPEMDGIHAAKLIQGSGTRIIFLSVGDGAGQLDAFREAGGLAFVLKARMCSDLILAIREVLAGGTFFTDANNT
jgi:DNA-binding NarL/FixJ family response regulator